MPNNKTSRDGVPYTTFSKVSNKAQPTREMLGEDTHAVEKWLSENGEHQESDYDNLCFAPSPV